MCCCLFLFFFFFFKQKTAYELRISDWSSDVCPSDLALHELLARQHAGTVAHQFGDAAAIAGTFDDEIGDQRHGLGMIQFHTAFEPAARRSEERRVGKECVSTC